MSLPILTARIAAVTAMNALTTASMLAGMRFPSKAQGDANAQVQLACETLDMAVRDASAGNFHAECRERMDVAQRYAVQAVDCAREAELMDCAIAVRQCQALLVNK